MADPANVELKIDGLSQARLVRRGDQTELYQAVQKQFGRRVAVKVYTTDGMRDTALARFERECQLMGELSSHPNVVTYFGSGVRKRRPYVVSEWLEEGTYSSILKRGMRLDWMEAANVGIKVCGALESAHRMGLVHRKLKPEDLFVSAFGEPLVGDFQLDPGEGSRSGDMFDIMVHAAPELFRGGEATPAVDVYALSSVLFTLILGRPPFLVEADEPLVRIKGRALASPPPDLRALGVPDPLFAVLWWGVLPHPDQRPQSAQIFGRALQAALSAAGRGPARMLVRPTTDADRALPEPTLPAVALSLLLGATDFTPAPETAAAPKPAPAPLAPPVAPPAAPAPPAATGLPEPALPEPALPEPVLPEPMSPAPPPLAAEPVTAQPAPAAPATTEPATTEPAATKPAAVPPPAPPAPAAEPAATEPAGAPVPPPAVAPVPAGPAFAPPSMPTPPPAAPAPSVPAEPVPMPIPEPVEPVAPAAAVAAGAAAALAPTAVVEDVRSLLRLARTLYTDPLDRHHIDDLEARLDEPLRVAIAGKVKAGKSTLLNGLIGEELAPTDASECTKIVTWYIDGATYKATLKLNDGREVVTPFSRQSGAIDVDLQGHPAERVENIVVEWPSSALTELSLIDTPGIASISADLSARTHRFVLAESSHESHADAVVYLMRHLHPTDIRFLEAFQDTQVGRTNPINAIGVLSRADELAGSQSDALRSAAQVAARYRSSPQVRRLCQTVVPVAGLLAQAAANIRQSEYNLLARIGTLSDEQLDLLLASADRFVDQDLVANVVPADREALIRKLGLFGVRQSVQAIRQHLVDDAASLGQYLFEQSGLSELRRILMSQFASRRDVLKAQAAMQALAVRLRVSPPPTGAEQLQFELEKLRSTAHVFSEIQLFAAIRAGAVPFSATEVDGVERLLGAEGYAPSVRLGLADSATADEIRTVLNERIATWRARAENPLSTRELSDAAQVLVRTCEGMLRAMHVDAAA